MSDYEYSQGQYVIFYNNINNSHTGSRRRVRDIMPREKFEQYLKEDFQGYKDFQGYLETSKVQVLGIINIDQSKNVSYKTLNTSAISEPTWSKKTIKLEGSNDDKYFQLKSFIDFDARPDLGALKDLRIFADRIYKATNPSRKFQGNDWYFASGCNNYSTIDFNAKISESEIFHGIGEDRIAELNNMLKAYLSKEEPVINDLVGVIKDVFKRASNQDLYQETFDTKTVEGCLIKDISTVAKGNISFIFNGRETGSKTFFSSVFHRMEDIKSYTEDKDDEIQHVGQNREHNFTVTHENSIYKYVLKDSSVENHMSLRQHQYDSNKKEFVENKRGYPLLKYKTSDFRTLPFHQLKAVIKHHLESNPGGGRSIIDKYTVNPMKSGKP